MERDHTRRMGLVMPWTAPFGTHYPNSFWCAGKPDIDPDSAVIKYEYRAWVDAAAYDAGYEPIPSAVKSYQFDGAKYDEITLMPTSLGAGAPVLAELMNLANQLAVAHKDVPVEGSDYVSFFENAVAAT